VRVKVKEEFLNEAFLRHNSLQRANLGQLGLISAEQRFAGARHTEGHCSGPIGTNLRRMVLPFMTPVDREVVWVNLNPSHFLLLYSS
jgi:hypothetical protein